ncbi:uncharacterized protein [Typha angustifolia]|uniref:uncharacterized protein isoform X2 n=1 Tax=Typha angustifolia TaxID=59011 RepID=UPI003C2F5EED
MEERKGRGRRMQGGKSSGTIATATSLSKSWSSSQVIPATPRMTPVMGSRFGIMQLLVVLNFAVAWVAKGLTRRSNTNTIKVPKWISKDFNYVGWRKCSYYQQTIELRIWNDRSKIATSITQFCRMLIVGMWVLLSYNGQLECREGFMNE